MSDITVPQAVFVKKRHELSGLLKLVESGSAEAVELLIHTMNNDDEETGAPLKTRLDCANALIELQIKIAAEISKDQLTRQIAEIKAKGLTAPVEPQPGEKRRLPPTTDFDRIQTVE